ncbi:hypothetical protein AAC387_Pa07g1809 [Persea americana]
MYARYGEMKEANLVFYGLSYKNEVSCNALIARHVVGYVLDTNYVLLFVDQQEREAKLQYHSEKLALAFALLNTPPGATIRIKKNIRMCGDCHSAIKFVSMVMEREIVVRDTNRFHHFSNGFCSCGDYW